VIQMYSLETLEVSKTSRVLFLSKTSRVLFSFQNLQGFVLNPGGFEVKPPGFC